ncbi:transcriptional regulator [Cellulomonas sp. Root485]|jgi:predicted ArsR family transcriptional regulator|uniref:helix-turn-helix transcriptional regulator n=1 Tax=Cellulomonas sp. Root485 TaxID=1736546 RepID=UPI0006F99514|nr:helix-turn-helix domain-containing protein [Cellulomonas sp. Root485]KQY21514.1 transcriptional regulator [Cellulomonas sp. Root485]
MSEELTADVAGVAALGEPVRRELYCYVVAQGEPVSRESAAGGTGVAHHVAKFHLDKLVAAGLLEVEYRRPPGRGGPGAGRPSKLYRRAAREIAVSLPERRYDLAGRVMAEALTLVDRDGIPVGDALHAAARETGRRVGRDGPVDEAGGRDAVSGVLARHGYEPRTVDDQIVLTNCPFHRLAADYTGLVCSMNRDLVDGVIDAICPGALSARLDPGPDRCCVIVREP